ncbi:MAG: hypothetical protein Q4G62_02605 [Pseudomonadota bacterium]|nr:hypothetical protein [Pseudomonadota bacterium]
MIHPIKPVALGALAISVLVVAGCQPDRAAPGASRDSFGTSIHSAPTATQSVRGIYIRGAQIESLQPCGERVIWRVEGDTRLLAPLHAKADQRRAADPANVDPLIYLEGQGRLLGKTTSDVTAYDNVLELTSVNRIEAPPPADCRLPAPD